MSSRIWNRRSFLAALGVSAAAVPFARLVRLQAQESGHPKRMLIFFSPGGCPPDLFFPDKSQEGFELNSALSPLERHKSSLIAMKGLKLTPSWDKGTGESHSMPAGQLLTGMPLGAGFEEVNGYDLGWATGESIDHLIATRIGADNPIRSIYAVAHDTWGQAVDARVSTRMSFVGKEKPNTPDYLPEVLLNRVYDPKNAGSEEDRLRRAGQRQSVLDVVNDDLRRIRNQVGSEQKIALEQHEQSIREIERRLKSPSVDCGSFELPTSGYDNDLERNGRIHLDLIAKAFGCDATRVAFLQWDRCASHMTLGNLGITNSAGEKDRIVLNYENKDFHDFQHSTQKIEDKRNTFNPQGANQDMQSINRWFADQFAYAIDKLKEIPEGGGTVFDNTVCVWIGELGDPDQHTHRDFPAVIAVGKNIGLDTGRVEDYGGQPIARVWTALANHLDSSLEMNSFGDTDYNSSPLAI